MLTYSEADLQPTYILPVEEGGIQVILMSGSWRNYLASLGFPLDGGGGFMLGEVETLNGFDVVLVLAVPEGYERPSPFSTGLYRGYGSETMLLTLAAPIAMPDGTEVPWCTSVDVGVPGVQKVLGQLARQEKTRLLLLDPFSGEVIGQESLPLSELRTELKKTLAGSQGLRPMTATEHERAVRRAYRVICELPPQTRSRVGRNEPCPCGSEKKFKRCCLDEHGAEEAPHARQSSKQTCTALVIPAEGPVREVELPPTDCLAQLQELVGGRIEALPLPEFIDPRGKATAYINEEGKFDPDCRPNPRATDLLVPGIGLFPGDYIAGTMVLVGFDGLTGEHTPTLPQRVIDRVRLIEHEAA